MGNTKRGTKITKKGTKKLKEEKESIKELIEEVESKKLKAFMETFLGNLCTSLRIPHILPQP